MVNSKMISFSIIDQHSSLIEEYSDIITHFCMDVIKHNTDPRMKSKASQLLCVSVIRFVSQRLIIFEDQGFIEHLFTSNYKYTFQLFLDSFDSSAKLLAVLALTNPILQGVRDHELGMFSFKYMDHVFKSYNLPEGYFQCSERIGIEYTLPDTNWIEIVQCNSHNELPLYI